MERDSGRNFPERKKFLSRYSLFPVFTTKIFCTICLDYFHIERKRKFYRYFVNDTTRSRSCFQCQKKYQYHLTEVFHRNFLTTGKRSRLRNAWFPITIQFRFLETVFVVIFFKTMCNKTIIRFDFCDILNNQGLGKCYEPRPSTPLITPLLKEKHISARDSWR